MIEHDLMLIEETLRIVHDDDGDMGHEGDDRHQQHYASPSSGAGSSFVSR